MINQKSAVFIITSFLVIYTFYYNLHFNNTYKINIDYDVKKLRRREPIYIYNGTEDFLINTTGCYIPNYGKTLKFKESGIYKNSCGERAIFIERVGNDDIKFRIDTKTMKKYYSKKKITCCYKFVSRSTVAGQEHTQLSYTKCKPFKNGVKMKLKEEIITVTCATPSNKKDFFSRSVVYEDAYVFVKKLATGKQRAEDNWNILVLGMDTMSRARLFNSMPSTAQYLQQQRWLDYKGYQKVGYNTFPNLIAMLTGRNLSTIYTKCATGLHLCDDLFIWSKFRKTGYITAYGEDNLSLPDTFAKYDVVQTNPTDHYMRPFFLTGEQSKGNLICTRHKPSAKHILDYAYEFTNTYKNDKFFGIFWLNSYSHNLNNNPTLLDKDMVSFFEQLSDSGVMNNTIIIFLSDHGIRFGDMRIPIESYYEERLPMFFVWIPDRFQQLKEEKYYSLQLNQNRLVTPHDLYLTLAELSNSSDVKSEACPQCTSLFAEKSEYRTCADAGVSDKWCSCHDITKVESIEADVNRSLQLAVKYIQNMTDSVKTIDCMACYSLRMESVLRSHSYKGSGNKTHYVIAWQMAPGKVSFEATVVKDGNEFTISPPTTTISTYNQRGNCVVDPNDRPFCVCKSAKCSSKVDI